MAKLKSVLLSQTAADRRTIASALASPAGQMKLAAWIGAISKGGIGADGKAKLTAAQARAMWKVKKG